MFTNGCDLTFLSPKTPNEFTTRFGLSQNSTEVPLSEGGKDTRLPL